MKIALGNVTGVKIELPKLVSDCVALHGHEHCKTCTDPGNRCKKLGPGKVHFTQHHDLDTTFVAVEFDCHDPCGHGFDITVDGDRKLLHRYSGG